MKTKQRIVFTITGLAEQMYLAYGATTDFKNYQGLPMPEWTDLPEGIVTAWEAAAKRSIEVETVYLQADEIEEGDVIPNRANIECPDCRVITEVSSEHISHGRMDYQNKQVLVCARALQDDGCSHHFAEWDEEQEQWVAIKQEHWKDRMAANEARRAKEREGS